MDRPYILFQTETRDSFHYTSGYEGVSTADLQALLRHGREAVVTLEGELMKRQHTGGLGKCYELLNETARTITGLECVAGRAAKQVEAAVETLSTI